MKNDVERFGYDNLVHDFKFRKSVAKWQWMLDEIAREKKVFSAFLHTVGFSFLMHSFSLSLSLSLSLSIYIYIYIYIYIAILKFQIWGIN